MIECVVLAIAPGLCQTELARYIHVNYRGEGMYILVIDDDVLGLELLRFTLRNCGYEVECSDNPRGAIRMIERRLPDLLMLDVKMPGMDGFSFAKYLKKEGYAIPYIF